MKKRVPSLTLNYALQVEANSYLVDKSGYIKALEQFSHDYVFCLRPGRFGKSLLLSMLEYYYGLEYLDRFYELFGEYHIGKTEKRTALKNSFHIMLFNFSGISS